MLLLRSNSQTRFFIKINYFYIGHKYKHLFCTITNCMRDNFEKEVLKEYWCLKA